MLQEIDTRINKIKKHKYRSKTEKELVLIKLISIKKWLEDWEIEIYINNDQIKANIIINRINNMLNEIENKKILKY